MPCSVIERSARPKGRRVIFQAALAVALSIAAPMPLAPSMKAASAPVADPAALHAVEVLDALLLGQEYSLFYGGFEY